MGPKDAVGMPNSVDPDQTAPPSEAVLSASTLLVQTCLSEMIITVSFDVSRVMTHFESLQPCRQFALLTAFSLFESYRKGKAKKVEFS